MPLQYETLKIDVADSIGWVTLNRPERQNSFGEDMREELVQALLGMQEDAGVKVVVVTGAGRAFCTGGDMRQVLALKEEGAGFEKLRPLLDEGRRVVTLIHEMPKPVVAMVNGPATGAGMSLALACDIRIASDHATFTQNFVHAGLHPDWGASYFLPRLIGAGRALELMWTGRLFTAQEALEMGYVTAVYEPDDLMPKALELARQIAKGPATAVQLTKKLAYRSQNIPFDEHLDMAQMAMFVAQSTEDAREGPRAFVEKREPNFKGF